MKDVRVVLAPLCLVAVRTQPHPESVFYGGSGPRSRQVSVVPCGKLATVVCADRENYSNPPHEWFACDDPEHRLSATDSKPVKEWLAEHGVVVGNEQEPLKADACPHGVPYSEPHCNDCLRQMIDDANPRRPK